MTDTSHLDALEVRLSHERGYLAAAVKTQEIALRKVWISQIEKEIRQERSFLQLEVVHDCDLSDDELLAELGA